MGNKRKLKNCKILLSTPASLVYAFKCGAAQENVDHKNSISPSGGSGKIESVSCSINDSVQSHD